MYILLTHEECQHIAYCFNERAIRGVPGVAVHAPSLRRRFISAALGGPSPLLFNLDDDELRTLDTLLTDADPRGGKLPDGRPILLLAEKVWSTLVGQNGDVDAEDRNADADAHNRTAPYGPGHDALA